MWAALAKKTITKLVDKLEDEDPRKSKIEDLTLKIKRLREKIS